MNSLPPVSSLSSSANTETFVQNISSEFPRLFAGLNDSAPPLPEEVAKAGAKYMPFSIGAYGDGQYIDSEWEEVSPAEFGAQLNYAKSGMQSSLYHNRETDEWVLAFRGTDFGNRLADVRADLLGVAGGVAQGVHDALAVARKAKENYGDNLAVTGHSLGGGYAMAAGLAIGSKAVTFDALGFGVAGREVIGEDNITANTSLITNLNARGNFVSDLDHNSDPQTVGGDQIGGSYFYSTDGFNVLPGLQWTSTIGGVIAHTPNLQLEELREQAYGVPDSTNDFIDSLSFVSQLVKSSIRG